MEDFVTYDLAVKLKEKGFRNECIATYDIDDKEFDFNNYILRVAYQMNMTAKDCLRVFNDSNCGLIDAPTIPQVLKWLREEKKMHIQILFVCPPNRWEYITVKMTNNEHRGMCANFTSYEEAALAGIEYVLDNLIL